MCQASDTEASRSGAAVPFRCWKEQAKGDDGFGPRNAGEARGGLAGKPATRPAPVRCTPRPAWELSGYAFGEAAKVDDCLALLDWFPAKFGLVPGRPG